ATRLNDTGAPRDGIIYRAAVGGGIRPSLCKGLGGLSCGSAVARNAFRQIPFVADCWNRGSLEYCIRDGRGLGGHQVSVRRQERPGHADRHSLWGVAGDFGINLRFGVRSTRLVWRM